MPDNPAMEEPNHFWAPLIEHVVIWEDDSHVDSSAVNAPLEATPDDFNHQHHDDSQQADHHVDVTHETMPENVPDTDHTA